MTNSRRRNTFLIENRFVLHSVMLLTATRLFSNCTQVREAIFHNIDQVKYKVWYSKTIPKIKFFFLKSYSSKHNRVKVTSYPPLFIPNIFKTCSEDVQLFTSTLAL